MINIIPNWHPVFVHFTVALLIIATITHLLSRFLPGGELARQLTIVALEPETRRGVYPVHRRGRLVCLQHGQS